MKNRLLSILLLLALAFGMLSTAAIAAEDFNPWADGSEGQVDRTDVPDDTIIDTGAVDVQELNTSEACIQFIKDIEGFVASPIHDVSQYSIGYGCSTVYAEKHHFSTTSITKEEAHELLLYVLRDLEAKLDEFCTKNNIQLTQCQYDALISLTFNIGTSWLNPNYRLASMLIKGGYSVNEIASAIGIWCHVGKEVDRVLVDRRIREIKMFLYGSYEKESVHKFCTLTFDGNGGSPEVDIAFYLEGSTYGNLFSAEHETEKFAGWCTEDGQRVMPSTVVTESKKVYAQWGESWYESAADVFSDVRADQWYIQYVDDLYNAGVLNGYPDGTFRPNATVTTGEALKMILLAARYPEPEKAQSHWARGYLNQALEEGILDHGDISDLDVAISRRMMAKVVANAMRIMPLSTESPFTDTSDPYVIALYDYGISDGYPDGTFLPRNYLTRAELSAIVWRIQNML